MLTVDDAQPVLRRQPHPARRRASTCPTAQCTTLLGRNGVGKTTLLQMPDGPAADRAPATIRFDGTDIAALPPYARARARHRLRAAGPRDLSAAHGERESQMGLATQKRGTGVPELHLRDVPGAEGHAAAGAAATCPAASSSSSRSAARSRCGPKLLILDEPTEGIQPSIIKDIERAIRKLAAERRDGDPAGRAVLRFRASRSPTTTS